MIERLTDLEWGSVAGFAWIPVELKLGPRPGVGQAHPNSPTGPSIVPPHYLPQAHHGRVES